MELRTYQSTCIENCRKALAEAFSVILLYSPTGSGKTVVASNIMERAATKGKRVIFVVNRVHLVKQASKHLKNIGLTHGIVQSDNTWGTDRNVLVCSVQTLTRRGYPDADLVIIDEAHGITSDTYQRLIEYYRSNNVPIIGLTATPFTKGLGKTFQKLVVAATIPELIKLGHLVDCEIYAPPGPDLTNVPIVNGDYEEQSLGKAVDQHDLIADIVDTWLEHSGGLSTILFATNILHSKHCCDEFNSRGIPAEHVDCYTSDDEREAVQQRFDTGVTLVLCNVDVYSEGWDCPRATVMILARPTRKLTRYIQRAGRILRPFPGKTIGLILDHSKTSWEFGYPTDELPLELNTKTPAKKSEPSDKKEKIAKPCPKCHFLIPPGVYPCPKCGFAMQAQNEIEVGEGKLTKLQRKYLFTPDQLQEFWGGCLFLAEKRGKPRTWAARLYSDITHKWPKGLNEISCNPNQTVLNFDVHARIKASFYNKRKSS
jgi:superfamily II DNA or RNA helicase